jgi:signal transduction histidine kinase
VITDAARRASEHNLGERLALGGPADELTELADTFDGMLDRLDRAFAAQRRFVGNASHELRTPLTMMRTAIDVTLAKPGRTEQHLEDMAIRVRRSVDRAEAMIDALLTLARSDQGVDGAEPVDLATLAEDALDAAAPGIARLGLKVDCRLEAAEVTGDRPLLERMVWNLVDNAVRHNEPSGWIRLQTAGGTGPGVTGAGLGGAGVGGAGGCLHIANSGPPVPAELVPGLFEPFRRMAGRTGPPGDGVGLGLSIAGSVAAAHGGTVTARSQPGGGLDVTVRLPGRTGPDGS